MLGVLWCLALGVRAQVTPMGSLGNFDVRYPPSLPNDLDILLYGADISCNSVIWTWNTNIQLGSPPVGVQWGLGVCADEGINTDPASPAFGLRCIRVRYAGPARPDLIGRLVHFGVHLRPGTQVEHQEIWWTLNGQRLVRPCDPHIRWIWYSVIRTWVVCIANPTQEPFYVYGWRWFLPTPALPLPTINDLTTDINPERFQAQWQTIPDVAPGVAFPGIICIPPWCRIYIRIPITLTVCRPIVFQVATTAVEITDPPPFPNPDDERTTLVMTTRAAAQPPGDITADGQTGVPDLAELRLGFGQMSEDLLPPGGGPTQAVVVEQIPQASGRSEVRKAR
jgi:hypothetical protein